jgi:uncharacterized protein YndB with AHSA1/START domain
VTDPSFVYVLYIRAAREAVWLALTEPDLTARYWFGARVDSRWTVGAPVVMYGPGGAIDFTGVVLQADPSGGLAFTFLEANIGQDEGPSRVSFQIEALDGVVRLTLTHDGFPRGSLVRHSAAEAWPVILSALKSLLETGVATRQLMPNGRSRTEGFSSRSSP